MFEFQAIYLSDIHDFILKKIIVKINGLIISASHKFYGASKAFAGV